MEQKQLNAFLQRVAFTLGLDWHDLGDQLASVCDNDMSLALIRGYGIKRAEGEFLLALRGVGIGVA
jgi:hypothetical protein